MLRTNNKKVIAAVQQHILDAINLLDVENPDKNKPITEVYNDFKACYWYSYNQQRFNHQVKKAFIDWCYGLPTIFNIEFSTYKQRQLLKLWLEESDEEANKFDDEKVEKLYNELIVTNFFKMLNNEQTGKAHYTIANI